MQIAEHFPNSGKDNQPKTKNLLRKVAGRLALAATMFAASTGILSVPDTAHAEARPSGASIEQYKGNGKVKAHGNVVKDCANTLGCWTYMKVEKYEPNARFQNPFNHDVEYGWKFVGGRWIENGTSTLEANCAGNGVYRAVVEAYNALPADTGSLHVGIEHNGVGIGYDHPTGSGVRNFRVADYSAPIVAC